MIVLELIRIVLGLVFLLVLPGYTFLFATRWKYESEIERWVVVFVLSLGFILLNGVLLDITWEISLFPIILYNLLFVLVFLIVGAIRYIKNGPLCIEKTDEKIISKEERAIYNAMIVACVIGIVFVSIFIYLIRPDSEKYTQLYFYQEKVPLNSDGTFSYLGYMGKLEYDNGTFSVYIDTNNDSAFELVYQKSNYAILTHNTFKMNNTDWHIGDVSHKEILFSNYPIKNIDSEYSFSFVISNKERVAKNYTYEIKISDTLIHSDTVYVENEETVRIYASVLVSLTSGQDRISVVLSTGQEIYFWEKFTLLYFHQEEISLTRYSEGIRLENATFNFLNLKGIVTNTTEIDTLVYIDLDKNSSFDPSELVFNMTDENISLQDTFIVNNKSWHIKNVTETSIIIAAYPTTKVGINYTIDFIIENYEVGPKIYTYTVLVSDKVILEATKYVKTKERVTVSFPTAETNGTEKISVVLDTGQEIYFLEKP